MAAILKLWGIPAETRREIWDSLIELELKHWQKIVEPVIVAWERSSTHPNTSARSLTTGFSSRKVSGQVGVPGRTRTGSIGLDSFRLVLRAPAADEGDLAKCTLHLENGDRKSVV